MHGIRVYSLYINYKKGGKMKTITHKSKVYQIGERYVDKNGNIGLLDSCDGRTFKMSSESRGFWFCNELATFEMGTIEDAPIELEDGFWYMCEKAQHGLRYEVPYQVPYFYFNGFKSNSSSRLWFSVSDYGTPLYKMGKEDS